MDSHHPPSTLVTNVGSLVTNDPVLGEGPLGLLTDAALLIDGTDIAWVGPAAHAASADEQVDADGRAVIPGFVDSHSHLLFAGDRRAEFNARMSGRPNSAGGIRTTVDATCAAPDDHLHATHPAYRPGVPLVSAVRRAGRRYEGVRHSE